MTTIPKKRALRNRTIEVEAHEREFLRSRLARSAADLNEQVPSTIIFGDAFQVLPTLPHGSVDLLIADPPYNLTKTFGTRNFREMASADYEQWLDSWLQLCKPLLKPTSSVYICGDWRSGSAIERAASRYFKLRNRITWEREKGRGAKANWKNASEDIWFFTVSDEFTFNTDAVKQRRRVLAPYTADGAPKDWTESADGRFRDTHPSNLWTDITVPFWSMPENTDHPTQKPEKLIAKIILASSNPGDLVLDPFAGSGSTGVVAEKLGRTHLLIELNEDYCLLAAKRLISAGSDGSIQGFEKGVFWERNSGK